MTSGVTTLTPVRIFHPENREREALQTLPIGLILNVLQENNPVAEKTLEKVVQAKFPKEKIQDITINAGVVQGLALCKQCHRLRDHILQVKFSDAPEFQPIKLGKAPSKSDYKDLMETLTTIYAERYILTDLLTSGVPDGLAYEYWTAARDALVRRFEKDDGELTVDSSQSQEKMRRKFPGITMDMMEALSEAAKVYHQKTKRSVVLKMHKCSLDNEHLKKLVSAVQKGWIRTIDFQENNVTLKDAELVKSLGQILSKQKAFSIDLKKNPIDSKAKTTLEEIEKAFLTTLYL